MLAPQVLALIGLRSRQELVQRNLDIIEANVAHFHAFCERHGDVFKFAAPTAGSVAFARLLTGEPVEAFCERLVEEAGEAAPIWPCTSRRTDLAAVLAIFCIFVVIIVQNIMRGSLVSSSCHSRGRGLNRAVKGC